MNRMNKACTGWLIIAGLVLVAVPAPESRAEPRHRFTAQFSAAREPPGATPARARAAFRFNRDFTRLGYTLRAAHGAAVLGAGLHCGRPDDPGPRVANLLGTIDGGFTGTVVIRAGLTAANLAANAECARFAGTPIASLADLAVAMARGAVYVEIVPAAAPEGAIRGWVGPAARGRAAQEAGSVGGTPLALARSALAQAESALALAQAAAGQTALARTRLQAVAPAAAGPSTAGVADPSRASARAAAQRAVQTAALAITEATAARAAAGAALRAAEAAIGPAADRAPDPQSDAETALQDARRARTVATVALTEAQAALAAAQALPF